MDTNIERLTDSAMSIILNAGDARKTIFDVMNDIKNSDFKHAKEKLIIAKNYLTKAHGIQTNVIQGDIRGGEEKTDYFVLFAHAQDTLMTVYSEFNVAKEMIKIFEVYEERLSKIESMLERGGNDE